MTTIKNLPKSMIEQSCIGQVSVVGECFAFGCALDGNQLIYLDIAGPATSVEAVWAKIAQGKETAIIPPEREGNKILLRAHEGTLKRLQRKIEGLGIHQLVLVHQDMVEPTYAELTTTYVFLTADKDQTTAKLGAHINALVNIAVFTNWYPYLVQQGRLAGLLSPLTCYGGVKLWRITLDQSAWERLICRGLRHGDIRFTVSST